MIGAETLQLAVPAPGLVRPGPASRPPHCASVAALPPAPARAAAALGAVAARPTAAATAKSTAAHTAAPAAAWATVLARAGQVDCQLTIAHAIAVEHGDGFLGLSLGAHLDKAKTLRLAGVPVLD